MSSQVVKLSLADAYRRGKADEEEPRPEQVGAVAAMMKSAGCKEEGAEQDSRNFIRSVFPECSYDWYPSFHSFHERQN